METGDYKWEEMFWQGRMVVNLWAVKPEMKYVVGASGQPTVAMAYFCKQNLLEHSHTDSFT